MVEGVKAFSFLQILIFQRILKIINITQMFLILIENLHRIQVELFVLHVHFICVGLKNQGEIETMNGGIWALTYLE